MDRSEWIGQTGKAREKVPQNLNVNTVDRIWSRCEQESKPIQVQPSKGEREVDWGWLQNMHRIVRALHTHLCVCVCVRVYVANM